MQFSNHTSLAPLDYRNSFETVAGNLAALSDSDLVGQFRDLSVEETQNLTQQLEHIAELDRRRYFLHYPSLWSYLINEHGMEESTAGRKIKAARMLRRFPEIKPKLASGALNPTLLEMAQGYAHREKLSDPEFFEVLTSISGLTCKAAARELASQFPHSTEIPRDRIRPFSAELSQVTFVAPNSLIEKLDEIKDFLAHSHPGITFAALIDLMADEYVDRHSPERQAKRAQAKKEQKRAKARGQVRDKEKAEKNQPENSPKASEHAPKESENPQAPSAQKTGEVVGSQSAPTVHVSFCSGLGGQDQKRTLSQTMLHELINTKGYRCSFVDPVTKQRCASQRGLEIHHIRPYSHGGPTSIENCALTCIQHHQRISFLQFGDRSKYFKQRE